MRIVNGRYTYFDDFFYHILPTGELGQNLADYGFDKWLFRGEPSGKFKLVPSALREGPEKVLNAEWGGSEIRDRIRPAILDIIQKQELNHVTR